MKYYSEFTTQYVDRICSELNSVIPNLQTLSDEPFKPESFETLTDFLQNYVLYESRLFSILDSKNLINQGYCPYTGSKINNSGLNWSFMGTRKVYLSEKGFSIMKKEDEENLKRLFDL